MYNVERVMCADVSSVVRTCQNFAQGENTRERV